MTSPRQKFQELLRKLFQFDSAELDFGIYRIMKHKRAVIETFIEKDLLDAVTAELAAGALAQQSTLADELAETIEQIKDKLGSEALDAEGKLDPAYEKTPLGKQYLKLQVAAAGTKNRPELEAEIFNHLYTFFSRYYDEGDFMSLRRYSKREKYAIPYNGEEVFLHWANSDQYYIKTGENFTDYSYKHGNWSVQFKLRNADVEQNNVKGTKRFFVPRLTEIAIDEVRREITVPFEFRPLTAEEETGYGKTKLQEAIIAKAVPVITAKAKGNTDALSALAHEKRRDSDNNPVSLLDHYLRVYTKKNSTDFFIHKDLKAFLERELDFYLKNEVLNLDEVSASGATRAESWFELLRAMKSIAQRIIAFVSQIEEFQKRLFEKRKFITETNYCVTLDRVPPSLYSAITKNKSQVDEWRELFMIDKIKADTTQPGFSFPLKEGFLEALPNLVLDTRFFSREFSDKLLASPEFLGAESSFDDAVSGLLAHGDNFHVLNLVKESFRAQAKCIYLDPPYNTQKDIFPYKDGYKHSTWLAMLRDRLMLGKELMRDDAVVFISIDQNEVDDLDFLCKSIFGSENQVGVLVWKNARDNNPSRIAVEHEYVLCYARSLAATEPEWKNKFADAKELLLGEYERLKSLGLNPEQIQKQIREFIKDNVEVLGEVDRYKFVDVDGVYTGSQSVHNPHPGGYDYEIYHSDTGKAMRKPANGYRFPWETMKRDYIDKNLLIYGPDEDRIVQIKIYLKDYQDSLRSVIDLDGRLGAYALNALFGKGNDLFDNPKPPQLIKRLIAFSGAPKELVVDFFAGSGSTAQASIEVSRQTNTQIKYLFVDMADYFDTVLKPRLQKVIYSKEWKNGEPTSHEGSSHAFKYIRIESYEDALDNIRFKDASDDLLQLDDYVLSYMLDHETSDSATLLNVPQLDSPFEYKLCRIGKDEPLPVDLPETFNYLIGLHVKTRKVYENKGVHYLVYRGKSDERETVIIWRTTRGWTQKEFDADRTFIAKQKITDGAEDIFVNTDSFILGARSLDPVFKRRMFNEE